MNLLLPPLEAVEGIAPGSDHQFVATRMNAVHQQMSAVGWWSFNKSERVAPVWKTDIDPERYRIPNALKLMRSQTLPCDPPCPQVRGSRYAEESPAEFGLDVWRIDTNSFEFTVAEQAAGILLDVVYAKSLNVAPQEFQDLVVAATSAQLGAIYSAPQPPTDLPQAQAAMVLMDQQYEPTGNMLEDEADTLLTWINR